MFFLISILFDFIQFCFWVDFWLKLVLNFWFFALHFILCNFICFLNNFLLLLLVFSYDSSIFFYKSCMTQKFVALHFLSSSRSISSYIHESPAARLFTTFSQFLQKTTFVSQSTKQMNK